MLGREDRNRAFLLLMRHEKTISRVLEHELASVLHLIPLTIEDLVSEAVMHIILPLKTKPDEEPLFCRLEKTAGEGDISVGQLSTMISSFARNRRRSAKRRPTYLDLDPSVVVDRTTTSAHPCVDRLARIDQRAVIETLAGWTRREVAERTGMSVGKVQRAVQRGFGSIAKCLEELDQ